MSNNPGNSKKMYTSTPFRNKVHCGSNSCQGSQYNSTSMETRNSSNFNDTNEYQSIPVDTYNSTISELLNENELQLIIEPDTEDSYTNYKTPDTSYMKSNYCCPLYFENINSNISTIKENNEIDNTDYTDILFNLNEYNKASTSSASSSDETSTICSKKKFFLMENSDDVKYCRGQVKQGNCNDDYVPKLISDIKNDLNYGEKYKKTIKTNFSMETYPSSLQPLKKTRRISNNVPFVKNDDYLEIPTFNQSSDVTGTSGTNNYSNDKSLEPIYLKYSSKEDLTAKSDSINMLSVVISTVMLLASKSQIPQNYITWTLKYLKCIKNKQGQYPPNIKKIQKMLTLPSGSGQWHCMDFLAGKNQNKPLDLTKTRRNFD